MIIPAILEKTLEETLKKALIFVDVCDVLHIDFGDGDFVQHASVFRPEDLAGQLTSTYQVHLMVKDVQFWLATKVPEIRTVIFQAEAVDNYLETADFYKELGYRVGLSVNPSTPAPEMLGSIDFVQFMTIEPGAQGSNFIPSVVEKIANFKALYPSVKIQADGGISKSTIGDLKSVGVSNFVVGSDILKAEQPLTELQELTALV